MFAWCSVVDGGLRVHLIPKNAHSNIALAIGDRQIGTRHDVSEESDDKRLAVIRHPLDRIVSAYEFFCHTRVELPFNDGMKVLGYKREMTFDEFLEHLLENYEKNVHTQKQVDFIGGQEIDYLIPIEKLAEFWPTIEKEFNLPALSEKHANRSAVEKPWASYYTEESRAKAEHVFKEDVELYNLALEKYNG